MDFSRKCSCLGFVCRVFFVNPLNKIKINNFPSLIVSKSSKIVNNLSDIICEQLIMPFKTHNVLFLKLNINTETMFAYLHLISIQILG